MSKLSVQAWADTFQSHGRVVSFSKGEPILLQGDDVTEIAFVREGRARATAYSAQGDQTWLGEFEVGDLIGHAALLNSCSISFEVVADTDISVLLLSADFVRQQIEKDNDVAKMLASDLAQRLTLLMERYVEALTLSAKGRVCAELLRLAIPSGIEPDIAVIRPNPVFVDIALRINSTRETVSRTISDLQKRGILKRAAGAIIVQSPAALEAGRH